MNYFVISTVFLFSFFGVSAGALKASDVAEGSCFVPPIATNVDRSLASVGRTFVFPVASEYAYRNYAELFLGRDVQDEEELGRMCLKVFINNGKAITYGYNRTIEQTCTLSHKYIKSMIPAHIICTTDSASPGTKASLFDGYMDYVAMTDNKSYIVYVRCVHGIRDYKVISLSPEVPDDKLFEEIKAKITAMGFDPKLIRRLSPCNNVN